MCKESANVFRQMATEMFNKLIICTQSISLRIEIGEYQCSIDIHVVSKKRTSKLLKNVVRMFWMQYNLTTWAWNFINKQGYHKIKCIPLPLSILCIPFHIIHVYQLYRVEGGGGAKGEGIIEKSWKIWPTHMASFVSVYFSPVLINF